MWRGFKLQNGGQNRTSGFKMSRGDHSLRCFNIHVFSKQCLVSSLQSASAGFAKRKQYAGVPNPISVLNPCLVLWTKFLLLRVVWSWFALVTAPYGVEVGVRVSRREQVFFALGTYFWLIFPIFPLFLLICGQTQLSQVNFQFFQGFSEVLGGF